MTPLSAPLTTLETMMTSVDYEVACQILGQLIAHQVAVLAHEDMQRQPDIERATAADAERKALVTLRDALQPYDSQAIQFVLSEFGPRARQLNADRS
ncbi:hypothetical protein [Burkholderia plantarii]|uniref:hypothetical protein n=2 Tax=Burkholderia plantarii TaxID=41899 RepID=UPI000706CAFB|nr:hypothetical protein [Burkholderia plantarii]ALK35161.1 hypothetical protein bpln_1p0150 [Burkholderia plantarii]GLZ22502.1 hypothetical protein Bpla01_60310 [Burkholderia plantarii]